MATYSDDKPRLRDIAEDVLKPSFSDYAGLKFERFLKETKNVSCPGCGETGLDEYVVLDHDTGRMYCPKCNQSTDLRTMIRAWLAVNGFE